MKQAVARPSSRKRSALRGSLRRNVGIAATSLAIAAGVSSPALAAGGGYGPPPPPPGGGTGVGAILFTCTFGTHSSRACSGYLLDLGLFKLSVSDSGFTSATQLPVREQIGATVPGDVVLAAFNLTFYQRGKALTTLPPATITLNGGVSSGEGIVEWNGSQWVPVFATVSNGTATFTITSSGTYALVAAS